MIWFLKWNQYKITFATRSMLTERRDNIQFFFVRLNQCKKYNKTMYDVVFFYTKCWLTFFSLSDRVNFKIIQKYSSEVSQNYDKTIFAEKFKFLYKSSAPHWPYSFQEFCRNLGVGTFYWDFLYPKSLKNVQTSGLQDVLKHIDITWLNELCRNE